jgi:hypothetical protein
MPPPWCLRANQGKGERDGASELANQALEDGKFTRRCSMIAIVLATNPRARAQSRSDGARHRHRNGD